MIRRTAPIALALALGAAVTAAHPPCEDHEHHHPHNPPHPKVAPRPDRFITDREGADLMLPAEEDAFTFAVFGDRTGGPAEGVKVLAEAVRDANLIEPDLVMTVGDLVEGYNDTDEWMVQMREFKGIMDRLLMPWFPVAGNHDIYWRGEGTRPSGEHEASYELHFGPLWYAFEHKGCWFIALYSDEGNPETGEKNFEKPDCQRMSPEQLAWLEETLSRTKEADHVFVFLHHPRWLRGGYGDDWERVHAVLAAAGNVTAVFAGHIHHMRYDGTRDGIEYVTLATVGGVQNGTVPEAGWLHQWHLVTVRQDRVALASIPVGQVMDVRALSGKVSNETAAVARSRPSFDRRIDLRSDGSAEGSFTATITNPATYPIEVTLVPDSSDSRWRFAPDHEHARIPACESRAFSFHAYREPAALDGTFRIAELRVQADYLAETIRYHLPEKRVPLPMHLDLPAPPAPAPGREMVLELDGVDGHLAVPSEMIPLPDGPLTLECWFNAKRYGNRTGLVAKTENSEYGFFVNRGVPAFYVFLGDRYVTVASDTPILETGRWHHIAGVHDGRQTRLYVDGTLIATDNRTGARRTSDFPLMVGADVGGRGNPMSFFHGRIDGVRLSDVARYEGDRFMPQRRMSPDGHTLLLLNMDGTVGPWVYDESPAKAHPMTAGGAKLAEAGVRD